MLGGSGSPIIYLRSEGCRGSSKLFTSGVGLRGMSGVAANTTVGEVEGRAGQRGSDSRRPRGWRQAVRPGLVGIYVMKKKLEVEDEQR